jgi:GTPase SAR1 family protein
VREARLYINEDTPVVLVGNKLDLADKRVVSSDEAKDLAEKEEILYFETSAKDGTNVEELFKMLIDQMLAKK